MATHKLSFFEKLANTFGALYRHQAQQFPRRLAILKAVGKHELAPPRSADIPAIKADWAKLQKFIETKQYVNLSIKVICYTLKQHSIKNNFRKVSSTRQLPSR